MVVTVSSTLVAVVVERKLSRARQSPDLAVVVVVDNVGVAAAASAVPSLVLGDERNLTSTTRACDGGSRKDLLQTRPARCPRQMQLAEVQVTRAKS